MSRLNSFLEGVTVVDLTRHLPGPLATLLLADMGARVIKIEPPAGDEMRDIGTDGAGPSPYFLAIGAGKELITLDLKSETGRQELRQLVANADILVESFRPGTMDRLGVGPVRLREINPSLIYCAMSGFGENSPFRARAGHDLNYLALSGALDAMVGSDGKPRIPWPPPADTSAGLMAVIGILGALQARTSSGQGCLLDVALADTIWPQLVFSLVDLSRGKATSGIRAMLGGDAACYGIYGVRDGYVTLGAVEPKFWRRFCEAAGRLDWIPRQHEPLPQTGLRGEVEVYFGGMALAEARDRFEPADCCFAPVVSFREGIRSDHVKARDLIRPDANGLAHALFPARVDGDPPAMRKPPEQAGG